MDKDEGPSRARRLWLVWRPKPSARKAPKMILPGCDFHPSWQQAAVFDAETGAVAARKLAVRLYWMLRQNVGYPEIARIESISPIFV